MIPGFPRNLLWRHTGGTISARYCYSVWMRHLVKSAAAGCNLPRVVAEIGPGDSIGIGLAALLSGAERYLAFDVVRYADISASVAIFDDLVELFRARAAIPGAEEFPEVKPPLDDYAFPAQLLTDAVLATALAEERLGQIRAALRHGSQGSYITYVVPWSGSSVDASDIGPVDFIFSQAVMEHVNDIDDAYAAMGRWLRPGALVSHQIDFKSHGLTSRWDGTRALGRLQWTVLRGKRPYLINRAPCSNHLAALAKHGFELLECVRFQKPPEVSREQLAADFSHLSDLERETAGAYLLARKRSP